jgi:hypothetical protein
MAVVISKAIKHENRCGKYPISFTNTNVVLSSEANVDVEMNIAK